MPTPVIDPKYQRPSGRMITQRQAPKLYEAERKRDEAIKRAAEERAIVVGVDRTRFWTHTLPQALYDVLEAWDLNAAQLAAIAYLEGRGWAVVAMGEAPGAAMGRERDV